MQKEFVFKIMGGGKAIINLTDNSISISRKGVMSKLSHGFVGEKTIMIDQITSVQFKKSTTWTDGFLQFVVPGTIERSKRDSRSDENTIFFKDPWGHYAEENKNAEFIKNFIEEQHIKMKQPQIVNSSSNLDEIKKLKELLDIGAITKEEFDNKKKELLES